MKNLIIASFIWFSSISFAEGNKIAIFGNYIDLPNSCILYVRPSVVDGNNDPIRYVCKENNDQFWVEFSSIKEFYELFKKYKTEKTLIFQDITHYSIIFDSEHPSQKLNVACDLEVCFTVYGKDISKFHDILKQIVH